MESGQWSVDSGQIINCHCEERSSGSPTRPACWGEEESRSKVKAYQPDMPTAQSERRRRGNPLVINGLNSERLLLSVGFPHRGFAPPRNDDEYENCINRHLPKRRAVTLLCRDSPHRSRRTSCPESARICGRRRRRCRRSCTARRCPFCRRDNSPRGRRRCRNAVR